MNSNDIFEERAKIRNKNLKEEEPVEDIFSQRAKLRQERTEEISSVFGVPFKDIARQAAQYTSRGLEALGGLPGNVVQFAKGIGEKLPEVPEFLHGNRSFIQEKGGKLLEKLPTTSDIRQATKQAFGGFLEPETETESNIGDFVSDLVSLKSGGFGPLKAAGTALLGNVISPLIKEITGSKSLGENTKSGLYLTSAMIRPGATKKYGESLLKNAYQSIPQGETILTTNLNKNLGNFIQEIEKGGITPAKQPAYRLAKRLEKTPQGNTLDILELPATRSSINEYRFEKELNPKAHRWLNKFDDIINKELDIYGKSNPEFLQNYREGNEILANIHQGNRVSKFISKVIGTKEIKPETLLLLGLHTPKGLMAATGAAGASSIFNVARRLKKPIFRKVYQKTMNAALKENAPNLLKNIKKLDEMIEEDQE